MGDLRVQRRKRDGSAKATAALDFWSPIRPPDGALVYFGYHDRCFVIVTDEEHEYGKVRHASIAHPWRYPTWEEIVQVRDQFFGPDTECVMFIPSRKEHVNLHPNAFHLWGDPQGRRRWVLADEVPGTT